MDILSGLNAANGLLRNATSFIQSVKQPQLTDQAFSDLFKAQLAADASPEAQQAKALELSRNFVNLRDINGDKMLRMDESGLTQAQFAALDRDSDGLVTIDEVQAGIMGRELS